MNGGRDHIVSITHFINPHLFWYRKIGGPDDNFHVLTLLEEKLQELYKNKPLTDTRCHPAVGDSVAVLFVVWNKYIRAKVLQVAEFQQEEFIVWATDYGFPLLTKKEHVRKLPETLSTPVGQIYCGGLINIQPAELEYDIFESNLVMMKQDQWLQKACDMLEKLVTNAASIIFVESFESQDEHHWGDLIIVGHKGNKFNARSYLMSSNYAMDVAADTFSELCSNLKTTNIAPWLSNSRKTKLKFNSIKHNIVEHSQQMNSAIIDDYAKRKVQDWCERNARAQDGGTEGCHTELESGAESALDHSFDDITFDDSVSVIHHKKMMESKAISKSYSQGCDGNVYSEECEEQKNYIGKAGALTKLKQKKYPSKKNLPPQAQSNAFNMDSKDFPKSETDCNAATISLNSNSSNVSSRMQKLSKLRVESMRKPGPNVFSADFNAAASTISSSGGSTTTSSRLQKMIAFRKQRAREEIEKSNVRVADNSLNSECFKEKMRPKYCSNESTLSTENFSASQPYQKLEQSTTCTDTIPDKTQDTSSEVSIKIARAKRLNEIRCRLQAPPRMNNTEGHNDDTSTNFDQSSVTVLGSRNNDNLQKKTTAEKAFDILEAYDFKLLPKGTANNAKSAITIPSIPPVQQTSTNKKESEAAYEGLTLVPAGFDITRLQTYRDEENHWHRKKTTRNEHIPHDESIVSTSEEFLLNSSHDHSSSSSDFFQIKPPNIKQKNSGPKNVKRFMRPPSSVLQYEALLQDDSDILDRSVPSCNNSIIQPLKCSQQQLESNNAHRDSGISGTRDRINKGFNDGLYPSEISTTISTTSSSQKQLNRKRRQLKSPTSQISKIDDILKQHALEKERGNTNILDLKKNSNSHHRVRISDGTSSDSFCDSRELRTVSNPSALIENPDTGMMISKSPDKFLTEKQMKNISNYTTLMEVKHTDYLPIVEGEIKLQTKFIDHLVLAHSSIPLMAVENVADAAFLPEIHEEMQHMRVNKVYRIQVYSWSHVLRGNSLFVVNPARTGKTWSYLPALCSLVCCRYGRLTPSYGPAAIILVASSRHVESTYAYCRRLMSGLKAEAPRVVPSYGMRNFVDTKVELLNGCGILVTTPSSLLRLLKDNENEPLFHSERLQHIVIDDMDIMLSRSHEDFESAVRIIFKISKKSKYKTLQPQLIVTSRDWDAVMIRLIRKSNQPLLLIGDFLEAAVYGLATLAVQLKSRQDKNDTILRFIKKRSQSLQGDTDCRRILIMCNDDEDVETVMQFLTEYGFPCLPYYNRSTENEKATVYEWKKKVSSQILICTDARFPELQIQNVQNLIHYSMPTSWTQFTTRFSALAQTYDNLVSKNFEQPPAVVKAAANEMSAYSMILLDEDNSLQLPRLVDFMRKHNQVVHPDILAVSKRVLVMREESRISKGSLLCPQLLEFGECDENRCDKRHELTRFDVIGEHDDIPWEGEMRIHVLKVFSPTHYAARLLQHKPLNSTKWREIRRSGETLAFTVQMDLHYRNEKNLALHWPPHINDLCIYKYAENFRRAVILEAPILTGKNINVVQANLKVTLKLIDDGTVISAVKCSELFICHEQFKNFPAQAIDIRLMHIVPFDNERSWDSKTTKQVQTWIMDDIKPTHVVQVVINFALANTVWVKNLVVMENLSTLGTYRPYVNLKLSLTQKNFGMIYKGDRKHVREIAEEYGLLITTRKTGECGDQALVAESSIDEFESCQNESVDLIKFSSSNGDGVTNSSMESATNEWLENTGAVIDTKRKERSNVEDKELSEIIDKSKSSSAEENWDELLCDDQTDGKQRGEVFLPLTTATNPNEDKHAFPAESPTKTESWVQLPLEEITKVEIGDEGENGNWENIFLQIIDKKHMALFDDLVVLINKHVTNLKAAATIKDDKKRVYDFEPLQNCIVKYNNIYLRAKVHGVFGVDVKERLYRFYLCDYACFTTVKYRELYNDFFYETTDEIVNFTPYQSVHCTLAGIQWDRFAKRYQVTKEYLYACAVEERSAEQKNLLSLNNLPICSYKILMFECEKENEFAAAEMFNRTLVDKGITTTEESTKHYLEYKLKLEEDSVKNSESLMKEDDEVNSSSSSSIYTFEQLLECIQKSYDLDDIDNNLLDETKTNVIEKVKDTVKENVATTKTQNSENTLAKNNLEQKFPKSNLKNLLNTRTPSNNSELDDDREDHCCTDDSDNKKSSISIPSSNSCVTSPPPVLKALYKRPTTTWYETECVLFISICAPDITDYTLEVTQTTVLFATHMQGDEYVLFLNLLGSVNPQYVSHEIKGLNVVIRLVKNIFMKWPRLLQQTTKYSWLKYNYNAFDSSELEYIMPQQRLQSIFENTPHVNDANIYEELDSDDSEQDRYQTYNPIENNDDHYDPFS